MLVGVVTLARMVKLLLTVRRLANTWGKDGQRRRRRRKREGERESGREGGSRRRTGVSLTALIIFLFSSFTAIKRVRRGAQGKTYLGERGYNHVFGMPAG